MTSITKKFSTDKLFASIGYINLISLILIILIFFGFIIFLGIDRLNWQFITSLPSRFAEKSGIYTALLGSVWLMGLTFIISVPIGVASGIYLQEYRNKGWLNKFIEINITNLSGVPSIVYGILGLSYFVRAFNMGESLLAGSLTLSLLILPIIIVTTREALKNVPDTIRLASFALGASKLQTIIKQTLPASLGNIITGIILAISRAVGETAPLIVVGALIYVPFVPTKPTDEYSALPIQVFNWISRPQKEFIINAAAGIIVLLLMTFILNGIAIWIRYKYQKKIKW